MGLKVLGTILNRLVRGVPYRIGEEPVWFGHEKWSKTLNHSKNLILDRYGMVSYGAFCPVQSGSG